MRTGRRIPGVDAGRVALSHPVVVVRMAVGDAYGAAEGRDGEPGSRDESAWRTERIDRCVCQSVAEFSFRWPRSIGRSRLRRTEVDGLGDLRGHAQRGDGRAPPLATPT